jgi:hypothetical protein
MNRRTILIVVGLLLSLGVGGCGRTPTAAHPTPTPAPAWKRFEGGGAELWLPETYQTLDLGTGVDQRIAKLKLFGPKLKQTTQMIERSRSAFVLWASDSRAGYRSCAATVGVIRTQQVSPVVTLDLFVDETIRQLPGLRDDARVHLVSREQVQVGRRQAARMILEFPDACRKEVLYTLRGDDRFWMVVFAADTAEFDQRLPSFERSIQTFALEASE